MDENIMLNDEITEVAEDCVATGSGNGLVKAGIGAALIGAIAYGGYKLFGKIKAKKQNKYATVKDTDEESVADVEDEE
jgi:hypothetical protein